MEKKFSVLRIIGTLWKILAWITLVVGILFSLGILLVGLLGSGGAILSTLGQDMRGVPSAMGIVSSIVGFLFALVMTIMYFLVLYAVGDLIYLLLAIEENTRRTVRYMREAGREAGEAEQTAAPPAPSP